MVSVGCVCRACAVLAGKSVCSVCSVCMWVAVVPVGCIVMLPSGNFCVKCLMISPDQLPYAWAEAAAPVPGLARETCPEGLGVQ